MDISSVLFRKTCSKLLVQQWIGSTQEVKNIIKDNIDLLPREIYAQLVAKGLNLCIRQNQIHFWWFQLGQHRYKRYEDSLKSAVKWLKDECSNIILEETSPRELIILDLNCMYFMLR